MLGTAAAFYALETADIDEEPELKTVFQSWPLMVVDHFRHEIAYRLPFEGEPNQAQVVAKLSSSPLRVSLALRKQFLPLQRVLEISSDIFCRDHRGDITSDSWMFGKLKTVKLFKLLADESIRFSLCFLERRRVGLEEVSEIALLGE